MSGKDRDGYGEFRLNGKTKKAHRVSYELYKEKIPFGLWILHTCDVRNCVNPEHLYAGTAKDNQRDCINRGRTNYPIGERQHMNKLKTHEVLEIIQSKEMGTVLAKRYNVSVMSISKIRNRKSWKHLTEKI